MPSSPPFEANLDERLRLIVASYRRLTGKALIPRYTAQSAALGTNGNAPNDIAVLRDAVWNAPRAIVAHGTEDAPIFFYGNRLALQLFEMSFDQFARLLSRFSAEPLAQEARVKLLEKVARQGFADGYSGIRLAKSGKRFMITDTTVWNLIDDFDRYQGQAAVFVRQN